MSERQVFTGEWYMQAPDQSRIVVVSGLPKHIHPPRISSRLDRLSDNCGGKVLRVDPATGTARVLFRTNEWAKKYVSMRY